MTNKPEFGFGVHLTIDGYLCNEAILASPSEIWDFLDQIPDIIGMTKIAGPYITDYEAPNEIDSGVTGVVIIAESHISVHTFPRKRYVSVDVFSCKPFDVWKAAEIIKNFFGMQKAEMKVFDRGQEFPNNPESALEISMMQRRLMR